jgi:hypothetical protein
MFSHAYGSYLGTYVVLQRSSCTLQQIPAQVPGSIRNTLQSLPVYFLGENRSRNIFETGCGDREVILQHGQIEIYTNLQTWIVMRPARKCPLR